MTIRFPEPLVPTAPQRFANFHVTAPRLSMLARLLLGAALVLGGGSAASQLPDPLEVTRRFAEAGAFELALARVEQLQPKDAKASRWGDWEALRVTLLGRLDRNEEALKRAAAIPEREISAEALRELWRAAAQAAVGLGRAPVARQYYARLLWGMRPAGAELRQLRLAVVESYVIDRSIDDAYRSMLRFQLDFQPLERAEAERFVSALLDANRPHDAATWLGQLDPVSPLAAILRMRAGLLSPETAIGVGRSLAAKSADPDQAWRLVQEAGVAQKSRATEIEALEHRIALAPWEPPSPLGERVATIWRVYAEVAQQAANQAQLLTGNDLAWSDRASRLLVSQPHVARALFAHLAQHARDSTSRGTAQLQLVSSLVDAKLAITALKLFSDPQRHPISALDPHVRYSLGRIASEVRRPDLAVRFWAELGTPAGVTPEQWRAMNVVELMRAGMLDAGEAAGRALAQGDRPLSGDIVTRLTRAADDMLDRGQSKPAEALLTIALPFVQGTSRQQALMGIGRARELAGDGRAAAAAYLQAAVIASAPESEPAALRARELAAVNLARAGLRDDARSQYRWLARHAREAAVRESAARELAKF